MNGGNLRSENAAAIRDAIAALDYRVNPFARGLKAQRNRSVGILLPDITAPFFGTVLTAMDKTFREHGYHSIISCYDANPGLERDNLRFLLTNGVDGLIYVPEDLTAEEFRELTASFSIPVVQVDRMVPGINSDTVLVDNDKAVYRAVSALIEKGHSRIALISVKSYDHIHGNYIAISEFAISGDSVHHRIVDGNAQTCGISAIAYAGWNTSKASYIILRKRIKLPLGHSGNYELLQIFVGLTNRKSRGTHLFNFRFCFYSNHSYNQSFFTLT
jgi:ABC-type xylose transport system substrate-binding protein